MVENMLTGLASLAVVVKVLSPKKVVISRGLEDGVKAGQTVLIYSLGETLIDPTNGRNLGQLEVVKGRGKVTHLQTKMATVESTEVSRSKVRSSGGGFNVIRQTFPELNETISEAPFDDVEVGDLCRPI